MQKKEIDIAVIVSSFVAYCAGVTIIKEPESYLFAIKLSMSLVEKERRENKEANKEIDQ